MDLERLLLERGFENPHKALSRTPDAKLHNQILVNGKTILGECGLIGPRAFLKYEVNLCPNLGLDGSRPDIVFYRPSVGNYGLVEVKTCKSTKSRRKRRTQLDLKKQLIRGRHGLQRYGECEPFMIGIYYQEGRDTVNVYQMILGTRDGEAILEKERKWEIPFPVN